MYQAVIGISTHNISREAGLQAAHQALGQITTNVFPTFGIVLFDSIYQADEVVKGISSLLANTPYIGLSTSGILTANGLTQHAVVVVLFYADKIKAQTHWRSEYAQSGIDTAKWLGSRLKNAEDTRAVLAFADSFNGDIEQFLRGLSIDSPFLGALAAGPIQRGRNYQISNTQSGTGAMAALSLHGDIRISYGYGHGWRPAGVVFRVTRSRGFWVRTLESHPASDTYAEWFGFPAQDWSQPPLVSNVRLYPLGLEQEDGSMQIRAPLRVEIDGSFRMNATVRDGQDAQLMIGSRKHCLEAARQAANNALLQLGKYRPALALVLVDAAWRMLIADNAGEEIATLRTVLGEDVPIVGGYTFGQIAPRQDTPEKSALLNNHILVVLFGSDKENAPVLPDQKDVYIPPQD